MSPRFLADANVLSEPLKPSPNPSVLRQIEKNRADLVTASPVWHELLYGCDRLPESKRRATIEEYLWQTLAPGPAHRGGQNPAVPRRPDRSHRVRA